MNNVIAGRYELLEKIGDGGMAVVYKARCKVLKRNVAIKILKPQYTNDDKFIDSFKQESHAAAGLNHPNIVSIFDVGREGNINYIVMELVEGKTLSEIIDEKGPIPYIKAIDYARQIASGLAIAHRQNIVHRDIKPHNILVTNDGIAKITDFGIAKAMTDTTIIDKTNESIMGSVHYFSPEQARGGYVDEKSDIYSLGIVLFEMLTARVPFDGDNPVTVALMQINEEITPPSIFVHDIPPRLEKIVLKATEKYPNKRFKNAEEFIEALDNLEHIGRVVGNTAYGTKEDYVSNIIKYGTKEIQEQVLENKNSKKFFKKYSSSDMYDKYNDYDEYDYRDDREIKNRKGFKIALMAGVAILVLMILFTGAYMMGFFDGEKVTVPDFKGLTYEEAKSKALEENLEVEISEYVNSTEKMDVVVGQDPEAGEKIRKGEVINLQISKGSEKGIIPNLVGKTTQEAQTMAEQMGFKIGKIEVQSGPSPEGVVLSQTPLAGSEGETSQPIDIKVSDGKEEEKVSVPNVIGEDLSSAKKLIVEAGFTVGKISHGVSDNYDKGQVMAQQYSSGTKIAKGSSIDIRVSKGATSTISLYVDYSDADEEVFYMTVSVSDDNGTRTVISRAQRNKSDDGETLKIRGTGEGTITVAFDDKIVMRKNVNFALGDSN